VIRDDPALRSRHADDAKGNAMVWLATTLVALTVLNVLATVELGWRS